MSTTAAREMWRPGVAPGAKRAAQVADHLIEDVRAMGWPVGAVIGSEAELLERYHVSRAVFREAVRLLEHQQVVRTRRGPGGGLVVTEPTIEPVIEAVASYLLRVDARPEEVFEARHVLKELDARMASTRRNVGLALFVDVFTQVGNLFSPDWPQLEGTGETGAGPASIAANTGAAQRRMRTHHPASVLADTGRGGKGAEAVARHITQGIVAEELRPGDLVGTEKELIVREGVSRALLREAVRLLEHHHIARTRRGPGGGLFVMTPTADAVTQMVAIYLDRREVRQDELVEMRIGTEVAIADLAAACIDDAGLVGLRDALDREENAPTTERVDGTNDVHAALAVAARNRALELVAVVSGQLSRLNQARLALKMPKQEQKRVQADVLCAHVEIAEAVAARESGLAGERMRRHLEVSGG